MTVVPAASAPASASRTSSATTQTADATPEVRWPDGRVRRGIGGPSSAGTTASPSVTTAAPSATALGTADV
ncbi:hypothetical protein, partial [Mycolicibacterium vanbaalenii]|uniref:hypothetical protein n=1 Tax=Mycolicibacterium vanbaalenii TaxID=110539 RepID=UPI0027E28F9B